MNHQHRSSASWGVRAAWLAAFVLATLLFGVGLTCAVPLVAFATLCALRQRRAQALLFVTILWLADELFVFTLLGFPTGPAGLGWAVLTGAAVLTATLAAGTLARRIPSAAGAVAAFLAAFGVYEGVLWGVSRMVGAAKGAFAPGILTQVFVLNAVTFTALLLVGALSVRAGGRKPLRLGKAPSAQRAA